jgi:hypothetical protein
MTLRDRSTGSRASRGLVATGGIAPAVSKLNEVSA